MLAVRILCRDLASSGSKKKPCKPKFFIMLEETKYKALWLQKNFLFKIWKHFYHGINKSNKTLHSERQVNEEWKWNCTFSMVYKKVGSNALFFFSSHCTEIDSTIIKHVPQLQWTKKVISLHTSQNFITCATEPVNLTPQNDTSRLRWPPQSK